MREIPEGTYDEWPEQTQALWDRYEAMWHGSPEEIGLYGRDEDDDDDGPEDLGGLPF